MRKSKRERERERERESLSCCAVCTHVVVRARVLKVEEAWAGRPRSKGSGEKPRDNNKDKANMKHVL